MILESLDVEYNEKGTRHVYIVVIGKEESDEYVSVMGVSATSKEDCLRQCGGENKVIGIMPLTYMLESLEMQNATDGLTPFASYGGKNETGLN